MTRNPVRIGIIGAGRIAQAYAEAFGRIEEARPVAVADVREDAARFLSERLEARWFSSVEELLDSGLCEAVLICTPPASHAGITHTALARDAHVICEKPFTIEIGDAIRLVTMARERGLMLTMASKFRFVEDVIKAKSIVASGVLGEIVMFENVFASRVDMSRRWNSDPSVSGGGVVVDNGTHSVDIIRYFLGPVETIFAVAGRSVQDLPVEDSARLFARTAGGIGGAIDLSWSLNKERDSYIDIFGSDGMVQVGWTKSRYRQAGSSDWVVFGKGYDKIEALASQCRNFCRAVQGREPLAVDSEDVVASVEVIKAANRSLETQDWVDVPPREERITAELYFGPRDDSS